jgi:hypothetical protein
MQPEPAPAVDRASRAHGRRLDEVGGACGDLGTLITHVVGATTVAGLASAGVLFNFGP